MPPCFPRILGLLYQKEGLETTLGKFGAKILFLNLNFEFSVWYAVVVRGMYKSYRVPYKVPRTSAISLLIEFVFGLFDSNLRPNFFQLLLGDLEAINPLLFSNLSSIPHLYIPEAKIPNISEFR